MNMTPQLKETQELLDKTMNLIKNIADSFPANYMSKKKEELIECSDNIKHAIDKIQQAIDFTYFGQKSGGQRSTTRKTKAVRENGKKGGRPSSKIVTDILRNKNNDGWEVIFNDGSKKKITGENIQAVRDAFPITRYQWEDTMEYYYQKLVAKTN